MMDRENNLCDLGQISRLTSDFLSRCLKSVSPS